VQYTRYRRWTRVAVVSEVVQVVEDGPLGMERSHGGTEMSFSSDQIEEDNTDAVSGISGVSVDGTTTKPTEDESPLRQRLRRALTKPSGGV
jgi:hypothetical protein